MEKFTAAAILVLSIVFAISPAITAPFSGFTPDQLPNPQIDPPIQPEGYAFAIWGLIYTWLILSVVFGLWKRADAGVWHAARLPLAISLALGVPWLAIANASAIWATITIIIMALGAITALIRAPYVDRWWFQAPVGIYAGWLTAASWVSIGTTAAGDGLITGSFGWAFAGILGALFSALTVYKMRSAPEYLLTIIWALVGIVVANGVVTLPVSAFATFGIAVLAYTLIRSQRI